MSLVLIVAFIALMVAVIPVAHALVIASGIALLWDGNLPLTLVVQQMFAQTQSDDRSAPPAQVPVCGTTAWAPIGS